jgi:hypothetical protein
VNDFCDGLRKKSGNNEINKIDGMDDASVRIARSRKWLTASKTD